MKSTDSMSMVTAANLGLRFLLELSALAALGYWGFHTGQGLTAQWLFGLGTPLAAAIFWGLLVSPRAPVSATGPVHLLLSLVVFGAGVAALFAAGQPALSAMMALAVTAHICLLLVTGNIKARV